MVYKLASFSSPRITKNFENAIMELYAQEARVSRYKVFGSQLNSKQFLNSKRQTEEIYQNLWFAFFDEFGTHFIDDMVTGSRYRTETFISKSVVEEAKSSGTSVSTQITVSINVKKIAKDVGMAFATGGASLAMQMAMGGFKGMEEGLKNRVAEASASLKKAEKRGIGGIRGLKSASRGVKSGLDQNTIGDFTELEGGLSALASGGTPGRLDDFWSLDKNSLSKDDTATQHPSSVSGREPVNSGKNFHS